MDSGDAGLPQNWGLGDHGWDCTYLSPFRPLLCCWNISDLLWVPGRHSIIIQLVMGGCLSSTVLRHFIWHWKNFDPLMGKVTQNQGPGHHLYELLYLTPFRHILWQWNSSDPGSADIQLSQNSGPRNCGHGPL